MEQMELLKTRTPLEELHLTLRLKPITKKNSQQIFRTKSGQSFIAPSKAYRNYEKAVSKFIPSEARIGIAERVTVRCLYYMPTLRAVDLTNLEEATDDVLVKYGVLQDDNCRIIASHDGSRVLYDKLNPRTEIYITPFEEQATL